MKPLEKTQTLKTSGIQKSVSFGIKQSGIHHVLGILRDQLYSDKILANIREYATNAVDAHIVAGCADRPIEVTFPTKLKPVFKVRDFGDGLTEQEIQDVYAFYGESTKRTSNDCTGMLGIGSKSAFAYGDNFVIASFVDGKKVTYNAFIDPSQVGQISKLQEEDTNEENGIEISVPVREDDCDEFVKKGKALFEWFSVRPIVKGCSQFEYNDAKVLFSGDLWEWRDVVRDRYNYSSHYGQLTVVMGNIGYPVESEDLNLSYDDKIHSLVAPNLVLRVPIGDVEISASREKLQFTDYTRKKLKMHLENVREELSAKISEQFAGCKTMFDAKCLYGSVFRTDSPLYQLRDVIKDHLVWKGKVVDGDSYQTYGVRGAQTVAFKKSYRSERYSSDERGSFSCDKDTVLIENDMGHRRGMMGKILPIIHNQGKTPIMLEFESTSDDDGNIIKADKVRAKWIKKENFDGTLLKLSKLPKHKMTDFAGYHRSSSTTKGSVKNGKHSAKLFVLDMDCSYSSWHNPKSDWWNVADVDMDEGGLFVIIDKFQAEIPTQTYGNDCGHQLVKQVKQLREAGIDVPNVYAVKVAQRSQLEGKENWQNFYAYAKEQVLEKLSKGSVNQSYVDWKAVQDFNRNQEDNDGMGRYRDDAFKVLTKIASKLADREGDLTNFLWQYKNMSNGSGNSKQLQKLVDVAEKHDVAKAVDLEPSYNLEAGLHKILEKYSMLQYVENSRWRWNHTPEFEKEIINYVNVIDLCNKN